MTDFLSSAEHKRHFKECFFPNISVWCCSLSYWLSLFGQKNKSTIHLRHIGLGGHESKWWQFFIRAHWAARWCG